MQVLITTVCSLVAAIVGALAVHWLTRSRERAVWVRDSRIKEWQELLDSMTRAYMTLLGSTMPHQEEAARALDQKKQAGLADVDVVLSTRIFIADDVTDLEVRLRWAAYVEDFRRGQFAQDREAKQIFKDRFQGLRKSIVEAAKQTK